MLSAYSALRTTVVVMKCTFTRSRTDVALGPGSSGPVPDHRGDSQAAAIWRKEDSVGGQQDGHVSLTGKTRKEGLETGKAPQIFLKQEVLVQVSDRLQKLADDLRATVEQETRGPRHGSIVYFVIDPTKDPEEPEVLRQLTKDNLFGIKEEEIRSTPGFQSLQKRCGELGRKFTFKEEVPEVMWDPRGGGYEDSFVWHISISEW